MEAGSTNNQIALPVDISLIVRNLDQRIATACFAEPVFAAYSIVLATFSVFKYALQGVLKFWRIVCLYKPCCMV